MINNTDAPVLDMVENYLTTLKEKDESDGYRDTVQAVFAWIREESLTPPEELLEQLRNYSHSRLEKAAMALEELPIANREDHELAHYKPFYYGLDISEGVWIPAYNAEENSTNGWATLGLKDTSGSLTTWSCRLGRWAHVTADDTPSMPFVWGDDSPVPSFTLRRSYENSSQKQMGQSFKK